VTGSGDGPVLALQGVTKRFGEVTALDALSLTLEPGEFLTLLGPSGCGKTTALRIVAGFETPDAGSVHFRGAEISRLPPQRRGFGMVFQNYALFPHLSVAANVAFGLKARRHPSGEIPARVEEALALVDLAGYGERAVQALSGGQQQRVALARALAIRPPLLLLDEPLSNLDASLRERTRTELRRLVKALGISAVFVTHDQEEAFDLADRIAVMRAGRLRQVGTPAELYRDPVDRFTAGFMGRAVFLPGVLVLPREGEAAAQLRAGPTWRLPPVDREGYPARPGEEVEVMIRPEELTFADEGGTDTLPGAVADRRFRGPVTTYLVEVEGVGRVEVTAAGGGPAVGDRVRLAPRVGARIHLFPHGGE